MRQIPSHYRILKDIPLDVLDISTDPNSMASKALSDIHKVFSEAKSASSSPLMNINKLDWRARMNALESMRISQKICDYNFISGDLQINLLIYRDGSILMKFKINASTDLPATVFPWPLRFSQITSGGFEISMDNSEQLPTFSPTRRVGPASFEILPHTTLFRALGNDSDRTKLQRDKIQRQLERDCDRLVDALSGATPLAFGPKAIENALRGAAVLPFYHYHIHSPAQINPLYRLIRDITVWIRSTHPDCPHGFVRAIGRQISPDGTIGKFQVNLDDKPIATILSELSVLEAYFDSDEACIPLHHQIGSQQEDVQVALWHTTDAKDALTSHEIIQAISRVTGIISQHPAPA